MILELERGVEGQEEVEGGRAAAAGEKAGGGGLLHRSEVGLQEQADQTEGHLLNPNR